MSYLAGARQVFDIEMSALKEVRSQLDESFDQAVQLVMDTLNNRNKIIVAGVGKSGHVGHKITATLTSTGSTSVFLNCMDALHGDLGIVNDGDLALVLSYSGESTELVSLLSALKRFDVKIVALTGGVKSTIARLSNVVLNVRVSKEACPFNLAPTASTTAMLAMGDALAMCVLSARGFKKQDFARYHPSGAIGQTLLLKVRDIMRVGERNPVISQDATVQEGLLQMTRAKAGSLGIIDGKGKLAGIFTDGDLRRHMAADTQLLSRKLSEVMTRNPVTVKEDELMANAINIFNSRNIDDLLVVNAKREPVGLVDSQDLPKMKLM